MIQVGTIIAERYEIVDTVGSGGMSIVYKALDHRLNRNVAIKVLKDEFSNDKTFVSKFRVEAQSAAGLSHPNIVNVFDVGDVDDIHYIVMELVEGITLKDYIQKKGHLSVSETVNFTLQIASGIEVAHDNHIIHRDIKPQNIIVSPSGILKVMDFGIAKAATSATISSNAIGSVHYISPEQARGGFCDERSDIYSLGITMYEMITGRVPFEGDNNVAVALMHIQNDMIAPTEYYPDILPSLEKVIAKCTEKRPERRYLTANALIADLRRVEADPSGSFVKTAALSDNAPTRTMTEDELGAIKNAAATSKVSSSTAKLHVDEINQAVDNESPEDEYDEEDDDDEMDPKLEKLAKVLGVVAAVLVVMLIVFFIAKFAGAFGGKKKVSSTTETSADATTEEMAKLPDVVGENIDDAKKLLEEAGFINVTTDYEENDEVEEDVVIEMSPKADEEVAVNEKIKLLVSLGKSSVDVPDVTSYKKENANEILVQEGFEVKVAYEYSDTVEEGKVIKQDPAGNTKAPKGSTVTITISQGKEVEEVAMINVVGETYENAGKKLDAIGLKWSVTKATSDEYDKGEVIAQGYNVGDKLTTGTVVPLTVCSGPTTTQAKTYSGTFSLRDIMAEEATSAHLQVYQDGVSNPIYDQNVTHDDFPFTIYVTGKKSSAKISIYLDNALISNETITLAAN
ncbi:MAG: Stk1 family PASTA domain-containing Ser/Thr kinase [Lachnospiraceae bacterium]|nr:Stk1 family PASTA domain-containing Ser/Thr kinase [Lachnospiraceae bacterium]